MPPGSIRIQLFTVMYKCNPARLLWLCRRWINAVQALVVWAGVYAVLRPSRRQQTRALHVQSAGWRKSVQERLERARLSWSHIRCNDHKIFEIFFFRPMQGNPENSCLWNLESWALESEIQLKESGIPLTIGNWNPSSADMAYLESRIHGVESRIQDRFGFPYMGWLFYIM